MDHMPLQSAIGAARAELVVEIADTIETIHEAHRLRHQVYCLERGFETSVGNVEIDAFDSHARHIVLRKRASGEVIGTARLIMPRPDKPGSSFPMHQVCAPGLFRHIPTWSSAEVSRFAVSKERRGLSTAATSLSRLALVRGLVELSQREGVTHWCAVMERTLLRLLRASSIHFEPMGAAIEYHGLRQPAYCEVAGMLERMEWEQPDIWGFVTAGGAFADARVEHRRAA